MSAADPTSPPGAYPPTPGARVYVVRVWYERTHQTLVWRAAVREGADGERKYFAALDDCIDHLYLELGRR